MNRTSICLDLHQQIKAMTCLSPPVIFYWPFQGGVSFVDPFLLFVFRVILSLMFLAAL